jgi:hypothetical protein
LVGDNLLEHLSSLGWEHINLTGEYVWRQNRRVESRKFGSFKNLDCLSRCFETISFDELIGKIPTSPVRRSAALNRGMFFRD